MRHFLTAIVCAICCACNLFGQKTEKPIMTFACLSDIHSQQSMISASRVQDVRLRTSFINTLKSIHQSERIDALVLTGGDAEETHPYRPLAERVALGV